MIDGMEEITKIPNCVGIIMDGNRRWAKARGLTTFAGHSKGRETLKEFLKFARKAGVKHVIAFAFSMENWKRSSEEVSFLLELMLKAFKEEREEFIGEKSNIRFAGDISKFPENLQEAMKKLEEDTKQFEELSLTLCVSYGGRDEIVMAVNKCLAEGITEITEKDISKHLYTAGIPDPDIIIRTSGEMRTSGFLPWQTTYSELFFTKTLWPDFGEEEFNKILEEYSNRERRMGK
jgi:undecaprenyl diphosphate synthase